MKNLNQLKSFVSSLSEDELDSLKVIVNSLLRVTDFGAIRENTINYKPVCPDCASEHVKKNGHYGDKQKYVCKPCNRGFGILSGTSVHGIRKKELWTQFISLTLESKSIRFIAKKLKINKQTCLFWRHKLLSSINDAFTKELHGIVEMDDMLVRFNQKGRINNFIEESRRTETVTNRYGDRVSQKVKVGKLKRGISRDQVSVLVSIDRYSAIGTGMLKRGKMDIKSLNRVFEKGLLERLNTDNTVVTDEAKAYVSVLANNGFDHEHINAGIKQWTKGIYHLNTLNNADRRFKNWIKYNFSSVSTKYLHNYLGYFKMLFFVLNKSETKMEELLRFSLIDNSTLQRKQNIENKYQEFLTY